MNDTKKFDVELGGLVKIRDIDLHIELAELAPKTLPTFLVKSKTIFTDGDYARTHYILDHVGSDLVYLLIVNSYEEEYDCKLFKQPDWFNPGHRKVLMNGECGWLFENDDYPSEIYNGDITYKRMVCNEIFDKTAIIEWGTQTEIINYLICLVETGIYAEGGGYVELYEGRLIHNDTVSA